MSSIYEPIRAEKCLTWAQATIINEPNLSLGSNGFLLRIPYGLLDEPDYELIPNLKLFYSPPTNLKKVFGKLLLYENKQP